MLVPAVLAEITGTTLEQAEARVNRYERTFRSMKPWLPAGEVKAFLDIGCGLGVVAMWVAHHYPCATAHLIEGTSDGEKFSYRPDGKPWADVKQALGLWARHCPSRAVNAWPPDPGLTIPCELIYSICSWGHHYAIETYLDLVRRSLRAGGRLIIDLRAGRVGEQGREALAKYFRFATDIQVGKKKYMRTVWNAL